MARQKTRVDVDWQGSTFTHSLETAITRGMARGAATVQNIGRGAPTVYNIRPSVIDRIIARAVKPGRGSRKGFFVTIVSPDFKSWWFEAGTNARRRRKVTKSTLARRATPSGQARQARVGSNQGVKAQRFMAYTLRVGWPRFLEELAAELQAIGHGELWSSRR